MLIHPLVFKLHKALRAKLEQQEHYLLAVSGGSDSMALAAGDAIASAMWSTVCEGRSPWRTWRWCSAFVPSRS